MELKERNGMTNTVFVKKKKEEVCNSQNKRRPVRNVNLLGNICEIDLLGHGIGL